jgi:hypothetical protein
VWINPAGVVKIERGSSLHVALTGWVERTDRQLDQRLESGGRHGWHPRASALGEVEWLNAREAGRVKAGLLAAGETP